MIILVSINSRYRYRKMKRCRCCWETNSPKFVCFFHFGNNYCSQSKIVVQLLTCSPLGILLETRQAVFWSLCGCQEIKHAAKPFTSPAVGGLLISLGILREQSLTVIQQSWLFLFAFSPFLFFHFSCLVFFLPGIYNWQGSFWREKFLGTLLAWKER